MSRGVIQHDCVAAGDSPEDTGRDWSDRHSEYKLVEILLFSHCWGSGYQQDAGDTPVVISPVLGSRTSKLHHSSFPVQLRSMAALARAAVSLRYLTPRGASCDPAKRI
jgi:hypothetical protein